MYNSSEESVPPITSGSYQSCLHQPFASLNLSFEIVLACNRRILRETLSLRNMFKMCLCHTLTARGDDLLYVSVFQSNRTSYKLQGLKYSITFSCLNHSPHSSSLQRWYLLVSNVVAQAIHRFEWIKGWNEHSTSNPKKNRQSRIAF